jgi:hypothetical protein
MLNTFGSHLHHNVVAYLALFFALGGTRSPSTAEPCAYRAPG